jgi:cytosine/adenosine deaminase-related metal-dependent hydrolase
LILRARNILPITKPPLQDGVIHLAGNRIVSAGRWKDFDAPPDETVLDLGDVVLLPGLVNAHCHLDYTGMAGQISRPKSFPDWIKALLALKAQWNFSDYAQSWLQGAHMLLRHGVTTVADIEAVPELLPDVLTSTPLRVFSFLEMTGVKSRRPPREVVQEATEKIDSLPVGRGEPGLSPHAPYSTSPELLRLSAGAALQRNCRLTTHVAESAAEFDMFQDRDGPLYHWLKSQRDMSDCGHGSPIQHLDRQGLLAENFLAVHVNYLAPGDASLLGQRQVSVAHCPRSHAYFQHDPFPFEELTAAGVNVCLGTDSLVSVYSPRRTKPELDLFAEMRAFAASFANVPPETILQMATTKAAHALGRQGIIGELSEGASADLIALPFSGKAEAVHEAVLEYSSDVTASMIDGEWAIPPSSH